MTRTCALCGVPLPPRSRSDRRYCDKACRQRAWYRSRRQIASAPAEAPAKASAPPVPEARQEPPIDRLGLRGALRALADGRARWELQRFELEALERFELKTSEPGAIGPRGARRWLRVLSAAEAEVDAEERASLLLRRALGLEGRS